jgi:chromosome segregation ATPase
MPQAGPSVDERLTWRKEKAAMEAEIRTLKKDVEVRTKREEEAAREMSSLKGMRGENERLRMGWGVMTDQYAELWDDFESGKKAWREEKQVLELDRRELGGKVDVLTAVLAAKSQECDDQSDHIRQLRDERDLLSDMVDTIRADQMGDPTINAQSLDEIIPLSPMIDSSDLASLLDLSTTHNYLIRDHSSDLEPHILALTASIMTLEQSLRETTNTLTGLQSANSRLEAEYAESRLEHAPCAVTISQLRYEADQAQQITLVREEELGEVRAELRNVEQKYERQAELVARANENEARSKFALESLEEEIVQYVLSLNETLMIACRTSITSLQGTRKSTKSCSNDKPSLKLARLLPSRKPKGYRCKTRN